MYTRTRPPLYTTRVQMKQRCCNPKHDMFKYYWWRWIIICPLWLEWYKEFYKSVIDTIWDKPSDKHTLDRIDNNWNYSPENIKWSNREEQFCNRSDNVVIQGKTLSQRARYYNTARSNFWKLYKRNWFELACKYYENKAKLPPIETYNWLTNIGIARMFNVSREAIYYHIRLWKTLECIYNHFKSKC